MRKLIMRFAVIIGALMVLSLSACTPTTEKNKNQEPTKGNSTAEIDKSKNPDPSAPDLDVIAIYTVKEDGSGLEGTMESIASGTLDENSLLDFLIQYGVLEEGTQILEYTEGEEKPAASGPGVLPGMTVKSGVILDLSQIPNDGKDAMTIDAIARTFMENLNIESITIRMNGEMIAENLTIGNVEK